MRVKTIEDKNQSWQAVSSHRDLATMSAFWLEKGKGPHWLVRDIIVWKREKSREAMMVGRERQHASHHPSRQVSEKPAESPLQGTWDAHQWAQGGRRGQNRAPGSFESPMEVQMTGMTYLESWNCVAGCSVYHPLSLVSLRNSCKALQRRRGLPKRQNTLPLS